MAKGPTKDDKQPPITGFLGGKGGLQRTPPPANDGKKRKNHQVEGEAEKLSPNDKAPRTDNSEPSDNMDIEITKVIPPTNVSDKTVNEQRKKNLLSVFDMIKTLEHIDNSSAPVSNKDFRQVIMMMTTLCTFVSQEYEVSDRIVKETKQIRNENQDLRYNSHVTRTRSDMEKSQRTVKVLNVDVDNSFRNGVIENMSALRESVKKNLYKIITNADLLAGSIINITAKNVLNNSVPVAILAATKDKKIEIEKLLRASAKKVVFEWPSSLYMHIRTIRTGYEKSTKFTNKQILIRPAANNRTLTVSTRSNSNEKWTFIEHLNFPLNPADIQNLGQKTQPCKSKHSDVIFNFTSTKEFYKTAKKNGIEPLEDNFTMVTGNKQPASPRTLSIPTDNRFDILANVPTDTSISYAQVTSS